MEEKRITQRLDEIPSGQLPEVLQLASELHVRDQAALERAQERRELLKAAAEAGLPPEYLERAAAQLQARQVAPRPERRRRRSDRRFPLWIGIALFFAIRAAHRAAAPPPAAARRCCPPSWLRSARAGPWIFAPSPTSS